MGVIPYLHVLHKLGGFLTLCTILMPRLLRVLLCLKLRFHRPISTMLDNLLPASSSDGCLLLLSHCTVTFLYSAWRLSAFREWRLEPIEEVSHDTGLNIQLGKHRADAPSHSPGLEGDLHEY